MSRTGFLHKCVDLNCPVSALGLGRGGLLLLVEGVCEGPLSIFRRLNHLQKHYDISRDGFHSFCKMGKKVGWVCHVLVFYRISFDGGSGGREF